VLSVKNSIVLLVVLLCALQAQAQKTIFVKQGGNGNGTSWNDAIGELTEALELAAPGDEIWVAAGVYLPTQDNDREVAFVIKDGVRLFGGFAGYEASVEERNWKDNRTFLSGAIGNPTDEDNSFTVVYTENVSKNTIVDGFIITNGMANGEGEQGSRYRCGGGWFNDGSYGKSEPVIRNCSFYNNTASYGAGLYNYGLNGSSSPELLSCLFVANEATVNGGAIYNNGSQGVCDPVILQSQFRGNKAFYGAGIFNEGHGGSVQPLINECLFIANVSTMKGSGIYNNQKGTGTVRPIIRACRFENNQSSMGSPDIGNTLDPVLAEQPVSNEAVNNTGY